MAITTQARAGVSLVVLRIDVAKLKLSNAFIEVRFEDAYDCFGWLRVPRAQSLPPSTGTSLADPLGLGNANPDLGHMCLRPVGDLKAAASPRGPCRNLNCVERVDWFISWEEGDLHFLTPVTGFPSPTRLTTVETRSVSGSFSGIVLKRRVTSGADPQFFRFSGGLCSQR